MTKKTEVKADNEKELIEMDEAIKLLKSSRPTFYRWVRTGKITGMKVGRQWRFYKEDIERFLKGEAPRIALTADIKPLIKILAAQIKELGGKLPESEHRGGVEEAVLLTIALGALLKASDIHITSDSIQNRALIRYRLSGMLKEFAAFDLRLVPAVIARWKTLAACSTLETRKPQDGKFVAELPGGRLDLRVSFLPAFPEESVTVRILDSLAIKIHLDEMPFEPEFLNKLKRALQISYGMIIVSGPSGSGKTTTLYGCLNKVAKPELKVVSVEDPVEYILPGVTQVQVDHKAGMNFPYLLRAVLRSDPDVIMVGELRDHETLEMAQQAALTGHLVLTTLHTDEAAAALLRLKEMTGNDMVAADSTKYLVAQRIIRRLCPFCSKKDNVDPSRIEFLSDLARKGNTASKSLQNYFKKPVGCPKCHNTGFKGRIVVAEILEVTPEIIDKGLRKNAGIKEIREIGVRQGMITLLSQGIAKAAKGETTIEEVRRTLAENLLF